MKSVSESALDQIILVMCHLPSITPAFQAKSKPLSLNFAQRRSEPISISSFRLKTFLSPWDRLLQSVDEIGLGIRAGSDYFSDVPSPIYYPGVPSKEQATIVELRPAEKRTHIDFQLPPEDVLKPLGQAPSK